MREQLIDRMIKIYGYEHKLVIAFCDLCERWERNPMNDRLLELVVEAHEAEPFFDEK